MTSSPRHVPLSFVFPESDGRMEGWGRFVELHAKGGRVATLTRLAKGDVVRLSFEAASEKAELSRADVLKVFRDLDGYFVAELRFLDEGLQARLAKALVALLAS
ncbi:MAG: hypothetical protein WC969_10280 [Elusimicrobiota bacterium]|jgi:hypothetical protein